MARADARRWWSRSRPAEPRATGPWWVERGERWALRPGSPDDPRPAVAECDAAGSLTVRTADGRLRARVVGDPSRAVGDTERRWREALGARVDDSLRVVDPRGSVIASLRPLPAGGDGRAVVDPFPRTAQGRRASAEIDDAEIARMRASGPWLVRSGMKEASSNARVGELVDHESRTLMRESFSPPDDRTSANGRPTTWAIHLECASLPVSWAFAVLVAAEILRSRAIGTDSPVC
ncbi:hypothetical protein [Actinomycetospora atypica]|uniref:Scramblase n=1 Tax=Actinomycetospora atypica TaxID=1290095 RepID=A0ABV9YKY3_9PSEU